MPSDRFRSAKHLLAAHVGAESDVLALGPALEVLRTELPAARVTLLTSREGLRAAPYLPVHAAITTEPLTNSERCAKLVTRLQADSFDAAIVFTNPGNSPHELAYAAYLAGIPTRLAASSEFAGRVLDPWVAPAPDGTLPALRHLHLLAEGGFEGARLFLPRPSAPCGLHPALKS